MEVNMSDLVMASRSRQQRSKEVLASFEQIGGFSHH